MRRVQVPSARSKGLVKSAMIARSFTKLLFVNPLRNANKILLELELVSDRRKSSNGRRKRVHDRAATCCALYSELEPLEISSEAAAGVFLVAGKQVGCCTTEYSPL